MVEKELCDPPRKVPRSTVMVLLFGGLTNQIGWPIFGLGMVFFWFFSLQSDLVFLWRHQQEKGQAQGKVTEVVPTGAVVNGVPQLKVSYAFWTSQGLFDGVAYTRDKTFKEGNFIYVRYNPQKPYENRGEGLQAAPYGLASGALPLIVPFAGLMLIFVGFRGGLRTVNMLRHGILGHGKLRHKKATNRVVNEQVVYMMFFDFEAEDGKTYTTVTFTHEAFLLEDDEVEKVLYLREDPNQAQMFDNLPANPEIDEQGHIRDMSQNRTFFTMLIPLLSLLGNVGYGIYLWLR